MKKLFMGSIAILLFTIAISIFQISCEKEAVAQTTSNQQQNKIVFTKQIDISINGGHTEVWIANYDGSNQVRIPISLPAGMSLETGEGNLKLSPDGQFLFFPVSDGKIMYIYRCKIDGSGLIKIINNTSDKIYLQMQVAY